jgi:hypothetical protein
MWIGGIGPSSWLGSSLPTHQRGAAAGGRDKPGHDAKKRVLDADKGGLDAENRGLDAKERGLDAEKRGSEAKERVS